jgi:hypothetical protein
MINFFRKIRENLLAEGKTSKYLKYAAGEIFLVVIGILIALQINNWNEQRNENALEQTILKRLKKEFESNKEQLINKVEIRTIVIESCYRILEYYDEPDNVTPDSIFIHLSTIVPSTFDPIQNDLVRSGNIEIIKNEELKQLLVNWSTDVIQLQEVEQMFLNYLEVNLAPYTVKKGLQRNISYYYWHQVPASLLESKKVENPLPGKSKLEVSTVSDLLSDPILEGIIAQSLNLNKFNNQESTTLMNRINNILHVLDAEIED